MIETMHDLGNCTDVEQLKKQKEKYHSEIVGYCKVNPLCAAIIAKMTVDKHFLHFIALITARSAIENRIRELEEENK